MLYKKPISDLLQVKILSIQVQINHSSEKLSGHPSDTPKWVHAGIHFDMYTLNKVTCLQSSRDGAYPESSLTRSLRLPDLD